MKNAEKMRKFKAEKGESIISKGVYCYDENVCLYLDNKGILKKLAAAGDIE